MKLWENLYPLILDTAIVNTNPDNRALKNVHLDISNPRDLSYLCKYAEEKILSAVRVAPFYNACLFEHVWATLKWKNNPQNTSVALQYLWGSSVIVLFIWKCFTESHEPACSTGVLVDKGW